MSSLLVQTRERKPGEVLRLNIEDYDLDQLAEVVDRGGVVYWDHEGEVRKIPNAILRPALDLYQMYQQWRTRGRPIGTPGSIGLIYRDETTFTRRSSEDASTLPRLLPRPQPSQAEPK